MKETFFFIHPDQESRHADNILNITRTSFEKSTGLKWDDVNKLTKAGADKWLEEIKSMSLTDMTYVTLYILHYLYRLTDVSKFAQVIEKLLADKALKTSRNIIWLCVNGDEGYGDVSGKVEHATPFEFNDELTIVDVQDFNSAEEIDEFITNYNLERV